MIPLALRLREEGAAKRYRRKMAQLQAATRSRDRAVRLVAIRELEDARSALERELRTLHSRPSAVPDLIKTYVDLIDFEADDLSDVLKLPKLMKRAAFDLPETLGTRRKVAVLLSLAKKGSLLVLNDLISRVFSKKLSDDQLEDLNHLRKAQRDRAIRLRKALT